MKACILQAFILTMQLTTNIQVNSIMLYLIQFYANGFDGKFIASYDDIVSLYGKKIVVEENRFNDYQLTHTITSDNFVLLTNDEHFINTARTFGLVPTGFNPFDAKIIEDVE